MSTSTKKFSILISTKNRIEDLKLTLDRIKYLIDREDVECIICDDGSQDGTSNYIRSNFPEIILHSNAKSKGYLFCRNKMLNETKAEFAISLDDDAHFVTKNPLEIISNFFIQNPSVGLIGLRIYWSKQIPDAIESNQTPIRMKSFVGCAHVWRLSAWKEVPNYPEWFVFYGEEDFASYHLFKKSWDIYYLPVILVNHRVDILARKKDKDYGLRLRRSLCSGWNLYFLFIPLHLIPRKMMYSIWMQFKLKVFKGDWRAFGSILLALVDLIKSFPHILKNRNTLSSDEFSQYQSLPNARIYWKPTDEINKI